MPKPRKRALPAEEEKAFGEFLKQLGEELRKARGKRLQKAIQGATGIDQAIISKLEAGKLREVKLLDVWQLCKELGVGVKFTLDFSP